MNRKSLLALIGIIIGCLLSASGLFRAEKDLSGRHILNPEIRYPGRYGRPWMRRAGTVLQLSGGLLLGACCIGIFSARAMYGLLYAGTVLLVLCGIWVGVVQRSGRIRRMTQGRTGIALDDFVLARNGAARGSVQIGKKRYSAYILYRPFLTGYRVPPERVGTVMLKKGSEIREFEIKGVMLHIL